MADDYIVPYRLSPQVYRSLSAYLQSIAHDAPPLAPGSQPSKIATAKAAAAKAAAAKAAAEEKAKEKEKKEEPVVLGLADEYDEPWDMEIESEEILEPWAMDLEEIVVEPATQPPPGSEEEEDSDVDMGVAVEFDPLVAREAKVELENTSFSMATEVKSEEAVFMETQVEIQETAPETGDDPDGSDLKQPPGH